MTAKQIQAARKRLNLTQEAFAQSLGVSFVTVDTIKIDSRLDRFRAQRGN